MKLTKNKVAVVLGTVALAGAVLVFAPWTTVGAGEVKVPNLFGDVKPDVLEEGFHVVNPLLSFDTYDIKENSYELPNVSIPSKDKFKSDASVTIMWSIDGKATPKLRKTVGEMDEVEHKLLRQPLLSLLREAGRSVEKAQDLFNAETQQRLQDEIETGLKDVTAEYGLNIHAVYIQDITLPKVISDSIITTKRLEEQEAQEQARLAQEKLVYARDTAKAEAAAKAAAHNKTAREAAADAKLYEAKQAADAQLYADKSKAEGNKLIAKSVTKPLLELKDKEIEMQKAKNWKGGVPTTVMGESSGVVPLYHMGNTK